MAVLHLAYSDLLFSGKLLPTLVYGVSFGVIMVENIIYPRVPLKHSCHTDVQCRIFSCMYSIGMLYWSSHRI